MKTNLICPVCKKELTAAENQNSLLCENKHCFDFAKSGYINLLLSNKMNSKIPGDNKLMVTKRSDFLSKGYYSTLLKAVCEQVAIEAEQLNPALLADVGCGEGYYTGGIHDSLRLLGYKTRIVGIDISKFAAELASKRARRMSQYITYAVASAFDLPFADNSCDILTELFAPYNGTEFHRVLKPDGRMILVIPAKKHLIEFKSAIYDKPYENEVKPYELDGFKLIRSEYVSDRIVLGSNEDIQNLFTMTPYYYKTSASDAKKLNEIEQLETAIDFEILVYRAIK